jgi:hypothetical protein
VSRGVPEYEDAHHLYRAAQHVAGMSAGVRSNVPFLDCFYFEALTAKDVDIVRPTRRGPFNWRHAALARVEQLPEGPSISAANFADRPGIANAEAH